jgi:hypothetical protein
MTQRILRLSGLILAGMTAAAHVFIGTYDTLLPLLESELAPMVKGTFHACWHFVSIFLVFSVWSFFRKTPYASHLAMLWIGFSVCFVLAGLTDAGVRGLLVLPQWIFLGLAGLLMVFSLEKPVNIQNR